MTEDEKNQAITWERFRAYHYEAGEDFLDQTSEGNVKIFGGWLMHKYPEYTKEILDICNDKYGEVMSFKELEILGYDKDKDIDKLYIDFAEFANQTTHLKRRINEALLRA